MAVQLGDLRQLFGLASGLFISQVRPQAIGWVGGRELVGG